MSDRVSVLTSDGIEFDIPLAHRQMSVGSQPGCDVRIDHEEVAGVAARLENRGGCYMLQNCNPYEVYIGDCGVCPDQWAEWPNGQQLLLTRSVSLTLQCGDAEQQSNGDSGSGSDDETGQEPTDAKKLIQLIVIAACVAFGVMMMVMRPSEQATQSIDGFAKLIKDIDAVPELTKDDRVVRRYLQEARLMDIRYRRGNPKPIMQAYQLLINHPSICQADFNDPTIHARIRRYAEQRLETLGSKK